MNKSEEFIVSNNDEDENISFKAILDSFLRKPKLLAFTTLLFFSGSVIFTAYERIKKPIYRGNFGVMISDPIGSGNISDEVSGGVQSLAKNETNIDIGALKVFLKSPVALQPVADDLNLSVKYLSSIIDIKTTGGGPRKEGSILNISINLSDKKLGKRIIDKLSQNYIDLAIKMRQKRLKDGLDFLNLQAPTIQAKNNKVQTELSNFRKKYTIIDPLTEGSDLRLVLNEYEKEIADTKLSINRLKGIKLDVINKRLYAGALSERLGNELETLRLDVKDYNQNLLNEGIEMERVLLSARNKYTSNSIIIKNLEKNFEKMRPKLIEAQVNLINTSLGLTQNKLESLISSYNNLKNDFIKRPAIIKEYDEIQQELLLNQENLLALTKARENFRLEIAQKTAPWTIISPPIMYEKLVGPKIINYLSFGAFISIVLGGLITFLRDKFDNVYHDAPQILNDLKTICLGYIPHVSFFEGVRENKKFVLEKLDPNISNNGKNSDLINLDEDSEINSYERFFYQEAFRNIITSLRFLESDKKIKTISITSSIPAEGKSLINVLLSKTFSELDKKVLLIDGDMRKPQLHTRLGLNNLVGLSNILTDNTIKIENIIKNVKGYENWDVITAGIIPPDPTRLLSSDRMNKFVNNLEKLNKYDLIIFDTPPIIGLSDASLIADKTDGIILVVTTDKVKIGFPKEALKLINNSSSELLGIIINAIKENKTKVTDSSSNIYNTYGYNEIYSNYANKQFSNQEKIENGTFLKSRKTKKYLNKFIQWLDN